MQFILVILSLLCYPVAEQSVTNFQIRTGELSDIKEVDAAQMLLDLTNPAFARPLHVLPGCKYRNDLARKNRHLFTGGICK